MLFLRYNLVKVGKYGFVALCNFLLRQLGKGVWSLIQAHSVYHLYKRAVGVFIRIVVDGLFWLICGVHLN
jgi:hypothetical protein